MKRLQCKDIPTIPVLKFIFELGDNTDYYWATIFEGYENSVQKAMPKDTPQKLVIAKMAKLIKQGYINGCLCGCRGDFEILEKGIDLLRKYNKGEE